ncbi:MAG: hypothetical protein KF893_01615 [Caldilineaceae bacterium]|nr:hypothetical protein [Caldilineaceae bacterium]
MGISYAGLLILSTLFIATYSYWQPMPTGASASSTNPRFYQPADAANPSYFQAERYGLQVGRNVSPEVQAANTAAIQRAVEEAGLAGGGVVLLPPGPIELNTLILNRFPNHVHIVGAGRDITVLYPQEDIVRGQFVINGEREAATTFLMANGDGSDLRLRVHDASLFTPGSLVRIRDLSTDPLGNGSWPYDPRPRLNNGEFVTVHAVDGDLNELHLVTPLQSSQNYRVRATDVADPGSVQGDTEVPLVDTTGYHTGTEVVILQNSSIPHLAKIVSMRDNLLTIDSPLTADVDAGQPVMVHIQLRAHDAARGVRVAGLSIHVTKENSGGLILSHVDRFSIEQVAVYGAGWSGIWLSDCTNGNVSGFYIEGGDAHPNTGTGYGLQTYHCQWVDIHSGIVRGQRRAIDISGEHPSRYVHVRDNILEGSVLVPRATVAGTHGTAEYCDFTNNIIMGGQNGGLLIRGNHITIQGNSFVGTHLAAIVFADGAQWSVLGNVLQGMKRWSVDSGGRYVGEFIRLSSPRARHLISQGNTAYVDDNYLRVTPSVREAVVWSADNIIFRLRNRSVVEIAEGASIRLSLDSRITNFGQIYSGAGEVLPDHSRVVWPAE